MKKGKASPVLRSETLDRLPGLTWTHRSDIADYARHPERFSKRGPKILIPQEKIGINISVARQTMFMLG
jgi:hypothetical protein